MADDRIYLPLLRGTIEGARCDECPFSTLGQPTRPIVSEHPVDPLWIVIGEGPGYNEVRLGRPFIGQSGEVVNKILTKIGRDRRDLWIGNATLCMPPQGSPEAERQRAAAACKPRLMRELAQFPGKPVLTLGAVAARSVIPKATLDAIDPPDAPKVVRKAQKLRQVPQLKAQITRRKAIAKLAETRLARLLKTHRKQLVDELRKKYRRAPTEGYLKIELARVHGQLTVKARRDAEREHDLKIKAREIQRLVIATQPAKPRKARPIKITDIVGTLFEVDVDGSGVRPLIPALHPAALLRGGGASIGGSHTPDMAFINLIYDAGKVDALARGVDIRLRIAVEHEVVDAARAIALFLKIYRLALANGAVSLDLETYVDDPERHHALMAYVARIRVIGLSTFMPDGELFAAALAWELLPAWCHSLLQALLGIVVLITHNGLYDRTVLRAHGFILPSGAQHEDTLLAHHAAFPGNSHRLQVVTAQFFGTRPWKSEYRNQEETIEGLAVYNGLDTGSTHALHAPLTLWVKRTKTEGVYALDRQMAEVAGQLHIAGMPVDRGVNAELLATFSKGVAESRRAVEDTARDPKLREQIWHHLALQQARKQRKLDPPDFEERYQSRLAAMKLDPDWRWKIGAGKHIAALLLAMNVGLVQTTAGGDITTKKDVLEALTEVPVVRDILTYREDDKLLSTFVWPLFDRHDAHGNILCHGYADEHDRIHPIWNVHRISGRWSSQWPVVSNVPKDKWRKLLATAITKLLGGYVLPEAIPGKATVIKLPSGNVVRINKDGSVSLQTRPNLRRQIRAPKGRKFVGFDFGQIEARVIALVSGDPFLCAIFAEGRDPHIECARIVYPGFATFDSDTQKQLREQIKPIEYGAMYLAQLETLHKQMLKEGHLIKKVDLAVAINALLKAMAGVVRWQHQCIVKASQPPYEIRDFILGRRRVWPMGNVEGSEAVNFEVQPTAAAIMNQGMARMAVSLRAYKQAVPIAQIHDAAVFECWENDAHRLAADVKLAFTASHERDGRSIPFPVDVKIGDDWSQV